MSISTSITVTLPLSAIFITCLSFSTLQADDDPAATCASAAELIKEDDLEGALEEARWCVTQLEQMKQGQVSAFFIDEVNGYKGGELEQQEAMGFSMIERSYSKDGKIIKVSLSGGASGAANNAFAALANFGMNSAKGKKVRIQKRTGILNKDKRSNQLGITLKSGGLLNLESRDVSGEELVAFAKKFPVADLDDSRK